MNMRFGAHRNSPKRGNASQPKSQQEGSAASKQAVSEQAVSEQGAANARSSVGAEGLQAVGAQGKAVNSHLGGVAEGQDYRAALKAKWQSISRMWPLSFRWLKSAKGLRSRWAKSFQTALLFVPGLFFIAIGLCAVFAPELMMAAVASFFVFLGFASFGLALRFMHFKKRLDKVAQTFQARIMIQGVPSGKVAEPEERIEPSHKKIYFH